MVDEIKTDEVPVAVVDGPVVVAPVPEAVPVVEAPVEPQVEGAPTPVADVQAAPALEQVAEPTPPETRQQAFARTAKQNVRDALAAQPYRGHPGFEDLLAVADAIVDTLAQS